MEACFESAYSSQIQGEKIKKQGAIRLRSQGNHFTLLILPGVVIDPLQVGGLSAQTWTVVNQLAIDFARRKIDERHLSLVRTRSETYSTRAEGQASISPVGVACYVLTSIFREISPARVRLFRGLLWGGDLIVIAPSGPSLTYETCSATFAPWQKRTSPLRAHRAGPKPPAPLHLRC